MSSEAEPGWGGDIPPSATEMCPCSIIVEWQLDGGEKFPKSNLPGCEDVILSGSQGQC